MCVGENIVCRLCLKVSCSEYLLIDETVKQGLDVLFVKMNIDVSNDPLMCEDCTVILKRSLSFKLVCMNVARKILSLNTGEDAINVDLRHVYAHNSRDIHNENSYICRFCMKEVEESSFIPLDDLMKENAFLVTLEEYMSHMDLNINIKNPLICFHCRDSLESYFKFLGTCRSTEEKINTYLHNQVLKSDEKIMLSNVLEQFSKSAFDGSDRCIQICEVKKEKSLEEGNTEIEFIDTLRPKEEIKKGFDIHDIEDNLSYSQNDDTSHIRMYKCVACDFKTKRKHDVKRHSVIHRTEADLMMYKCKACDFKTKYKNSLKNHSLIHKTKAEVKMYKCADCDFETIHKKSLKFHSLTHKTDLTTYKCTICDFKTIYRCNFKRHSLNHKPEAEVTIHKCPTCDFESKYKRDLKIHLIIHKTNKDLSMYKCTACDFKTKSQNKFKRHLSTHVAKPELTIYKCTACDFKTIRRCSLKSHSLIHKTEAEVEMYKCTNCDFKTKRKYDIKRHLLIHKTEAETTMYKCTACDFKTKHKQSLKTHTLGTHLKLPK